MNNIYSDFWIDQSDVNEKDCSKLDLNLIQLASYKLAISNFVRILTNKNVPVKFRTLGMSSTDGETVYISSKINSKQDFDLTVGLALHEAAHIVLSDINIFKTLWQRIPREIYELSDKSNLSKEKVWELTKDMINYVEDRYIDWYIYNTAVGYRGYYIELYDKYFNNKINDTALKSKLYRSLDIDSYTFRIFNFTNQNTDLSALPDLKEIYDTIDYENIGRLTTPQDRFLTAIECTKLILKNITDNNEEQDKPEDATSQSEKSLNNTEKSDEKDDSSEDESLNENEDDNEEENTSNSNSDEKEKGDTLKKSVVNKIKSSFKNQKKFISHQISKKSMSRRENNTVSNIENSGMTLVKVGEDFFNKKIDCVFVKNLTRELLLDENFPLNNDNRPAIIENQKSILLGINLGKMLGKRLQIRNTINTTKFMRRSKGKIDRRTLSDLSFDSQNVFFTNQVDKYKNANIHISVDASSSMCGEKWKNTITVVAAICKACSMINNVNVVVSFRTSVKISNTVELPYVIIAYDSTKDSFNKIKNDFCYICPSNTTPEGLCFEPIIKNLPAKKSDEDYYFINLSDGLPYLTAEIDESSFIYQGTAAAEHTRNQIKKVKQSGYEVLSYFIKTEGVDILEIMSQFKLMYGKNASFINVKNLLEIAKTLNVMFLKKEN